MGKVILLAEDDEDDIVFFNRVIQQSAGTRIQLKVVRDGQQVIDYLQAKGEFSDRNAFPFPLYLILDLKMPRMNGFEVLQWLRDHPNCSIIPKIVFSASELEGDIQRAYQLGANSYFVKPTGYATLLARMTRIFEYWDDAKHPQPPQDERC